MIVERNPVSGELVTYLARALCGSAHEFFDEVAMEVRPPRDGFRL